MWQPAAPDEAEMFAIVSNPETHRFLGGMASRADHYTRFQRGAGSWMLTGYGSFMVRLKGEAPVIGNCGIFHSYRGLGEDFDDRPEAGWILAATHVGKGIAREAMEAALGWFDRTHGPREVVAMIAMGNDPSMALARKLGFVETRRAALPGSAEILQLYSRGGYGASNRTDEMK